MHAHKLVADSAKLEGSRKEMRASAATLRGEPGAWRQVGDRGAAGSARATQQPILADKMEKGKRHELPITARGRDHGE